VRAEIRIAATTAIRRNAIIEALNIKMSATEQSAPVAGRSENAILASSLLTCALPL
jgi:hypothetical protein